MSAPERPQAKPERLPAVRSYRDLKVWQVGMDLVVESYHLAKRLPRTEQYGLVSQIRRSALSIPSNIAEGHGRDHLGDYLRHLSFANGSLMELETEILASVRLGYLEDAIAKPVLAMTAQLGRMMTGLSRALRARSLKHGT